MELPDTEVPGRLERRWSNLTSSRLLDSHLPIISRVGSDDIIPLEPIMDDGPIVSPSPCSPPYPCPASYSIPPCCKMRPLQV